MAKIKAKFCQSILNFDLVLVKNGTGNPIVSTNSTNK